MATESETAGISESVLVAFKKYERKVSFVNARRAAILAAIFMVAGGTLDIIVFPDYLRLFFVIRIICSILLLIIYFTLKGRSGSKRGDFISGWIALLPMISICAMIYFTGGGNSVYYAGLNLVLVGLSLLLRWNFWRSLNMTLICAVFYAISVIFAFEKASFPILFNNSYFLFVTSVFVIVGSYFYERLRLSEFALRAEVENSRETLRSQYERLGELDEAKTRFFANISHELRTPLTIMLGISERLGTVVKDTPDTQNISEMVRLLDQNGLRLMKLIDDLLDLVRFDTGHADLQFQPTPVEPHFEGLLKSLRHVSEQDNVALLWSCESIHPTILLDRDKFDKIVLNLVINAIKFTPSGGTIDVDLLVNDQGLELSVKDTGVGIPEDNLDRIFDRFWQVDTSSTRKFQGSGIGLALVRSVTESMGGKVAVTSRVGYGTHFTITFPVEAATIDENTIEAMVTGRGIEEIHRKAALAMPSQPRSRKSQGLNGQMHSAPHIGTRHSDARPLVLIADDEPDIRRFLIMQLENVEIIEAADGAEALELARLHQPQIALLDHMMPELDGVEVCRRIRENHSTRDTSVIILTARADEQTKLAALQAGANDFLTKPFSTAELGLRLQNQILMGRFRREMSDINRELVSALEKIKENEVLLLRNEKLSALGRMSAGIIHEINNPLNYANAGLHALATYAQDISDDDRADFEDTLKDIQEGVGRVSQIVIDLRQFTRDENAESPKDRVDPCEILERSIRMMNHQAGANIEIVLKKDDPQQILANSNQLVQVFINFFQNSIDAINERKKKEPDLAGKIKVFAGNDGDNTLITVRDNGVGIPAEDVGKIFDPFFTSKDVGQGMGLGLSITHQILQNHKVNAEVMSRPYDYTEIRLLFPNINSAQEQDKESNSYPDPLADPANHLST
ncbi:ATP-binding protein [Luteolibacter algae]|uniref:histidine kinase n=1 Tax=Luteolibacter algae TaxID=454151 RepID=A0ABW5D6G6_9BACT